MSPAAHLTIQATSGQAFAFLVTGETGERFMQGYVPTKTRVQGGGQKPFPCHRARVLPAFRAQVPCEWWRHCMWLALEAGDQALG